MANKVYTVLENQKYTGKHKVYLAGQDVPESEIFGNLEVALNGTKPETKKRKNEKGLEEAVVVKVGADAKLKLKSAKKAAK